MRPIPARGKPVRFIHPIFKDVERSQLGNGMLIFGSPGSGKTSLVLPYTRQLIEDGEKLLTLDKKAEQRQKLGIPFLAPHLRGSVVLDIGDTITTKAQCQMLADRLIVVNESDKNKVWQAAANSVGAALIYDLAQTKPGAWDWTDLADQLELSVDAWIALMIRVAPESAKILQGAAETSASVAFNVITSLRSLRAVADQFAEAKKFGGKTFNIRRWLHEKDYPLRQVILQVDDEYAASMGFIVPFLIEYIASQLGQLPEGTDDPKNIFLDEFAQLPAMPSLRIIFELGRSKGFNLLLALQDWAQVKDRYGEHVAAIFFSNASIKIIARTSIGHSQAELAQLMGSREVAMVNISHSHGGGSHGSAPSTSTTLATATMPLLLPGELESTIGPHSYIPNPNPGPGRPKQIPTKIRAYLRPMSGDLFLLDWPVVNFPQKKPKPERLPGHHRNAERFRAFMRDTTRPPSERLRAAIGCKDLGMTWQDIAGLLFSDGWMTDEEWAQRQPSQPRALVERLALAMDKRPEPRAARRSREAEAERNVPQEQADDFNIDDLMRFGAHAEQAPALRFEGLQEPEKETGHALARDAEKLAHAAEVAGHFLPHGGEIAHGLGLVAHAIEAAELLMTKHEPAPILTPTTPSDADGDAGKLSPVLARLAAKKRQQMTAKN